MLCLAKIKAFHRRLNCNGQSLLIWSQVWGFSRVHFLVSIYLLFMLWIMKTWLETLTCSFLRYLFLSRNIRHQGLVGIPCNFGEFNCRILFKSPGQYVSCKIVKDVYSFSCFICIAFRSFSDWTWDSTHAKRILPLSYIPRHIPFVFSGKQYKKEFSYIFLY